MTVVASAPPLAGAADLVLARMAVPAKSAPTRGALQKDVGKLLVGHPLTEAEFAAVQDELETAGCVAQGKRKALALTDAGRARALDFLRATELPAGMTWPAIQKKLRLRMEIEQSTAGPSAPGVTDLMLARMVMPAKAAPARSVIQKAVGPLVVGRPLTADEFEAGRNELFAGGFVDIDGQSVRLTDAGRARALAFLRVKELPTGVTWPAVVAKHLFPQAAGLSAEVAGELKGDALAALLLIRRHDLSLAPGAGMKQVKAALFWKELGLPPQSTLAGLQRAVLSRLLGTTERLTDAQLTKQLKLVGTGLKTGTPDDVRSLLVRGWLTTDTQLESEREAEAEFDLSAFAGTVAKLARVSPEAERFGDGKAFIAPLWRASQREPGFPRMPLTEFKRRLVEANTAGLLALSRADESPSMPADLVAESETAYLNATFHFVLIQGDRP